MIKGLQQQLFIANVSTLEQCSWDDAKDEYPSHLQMKVFNFDEASDRYRDELCPSPLGRIPSVDALVPCVDGRIALVEFKNRKVGGSLEKEIKAKAFSSLLMLADTCNMTVDEMRTMVDFVLVYKEEPKEESRRLLERKAGRRYVHRNLNALEGFCFRRVETYPISEFDKYFSDTHESELDGPSPSAAKGS